jgi:toxin CptA
LNRHLAPAVSYATGRSGYLGWAVCCALLLSAVSAGLYFFYANTPTKPLVWQLSLIGIAGLCSAFFAWQFIHRLAKGEIDFDGVHWYLGERVGTLSVRFDGQSCMLVRFEDDLKKVDWLWLDSRDDPNHWHDLRRAVYSRPASQNSPPLI